MSDEDLCRLLCEHFHIDSSAEFGGQSTKPAAGKQRVQSAQKANGELLTLEAFVSRTLPLLELEREAEVAQVWLLQLTLVGACWLICICSTWPSEVSSTAYW